MAVTVNVFKDKETLGNELVRFYRSHAGKPIERFFRFILAKHLLTLVKQTKIAAVKAALKVEAERIEAEEKKGKKK